MAAFFHHQPPSQVNLQDATSFGIVLAEKRKNSKLGGRWQTRTDKHLARARKDKGRKGDSDSDDDNDVVVPQRSSSTILPAASSSLPASPIRPSASTASAWTGHKLKKATTATRHAGTTSTLSPVFEPATPNLGSNGASLRLSSCIDRTIDMLWIVEDAICFFESACRIASELSFLGGCCHQHTD